MVHVVVLVVRGLDFPPVVVLVTEEVALSPYGDWLALPPSLPLVGEQANKERRETDTLP